MLVGCSKEKEPFVVAGEYETGSTIQAAPIQVFTKNGLVADQQVADKILNQQAWRGMGFSRLDMPASGNSVKLTIGADKSALLLLKSGNRTDTIKAVLTSQNSRYLVLSYIDSVMGRALVSNSNPTQQSPCEAVAGKVKSEYAGVSYYPVAHASGTAQYVAKERPIVVIPIKNNQLTWPLFSWLISSTRSLGSGPYTSKCGIGYSNERNIFNQDVVGQLSAGDTLVVQERLIPFQKK